MMAKIKIEECKIIEKNKHEINLEDIIYRILIKEVKIKKAS